MAAMKKIGRNEPCHCGSGQKYKKCCLPKETSLPTPAAQEPLQEMFITNEVKRLQKQAEAKQPGHKLLGTLFFFSMENGDAWLLEFTEQDAVKVAHGGTANPVNIKESEDYLEIGWTHTYETNQDRLEAKAITDNALEKVHNCPISLIKDMQKKFQSKLS